jgi:putative endopeptidase
MHLPFLALALCGAAPVSLDLAKTGIEVSWMDPKVDPCQDFFSYACGGFVRDTPIPADRATWGVSELIQKSNEDFLKEVLEKAAAAPGTRSPGSWATSTPPAWTKRASRRRAWLRSSRR